MAQRSPSAVRPARMTQPLRALIVADSGTEKLILRELERAGCQVRDQRVEDAEAMRGALSRGPWDVIISDSAMPRFSARQALAVLEEAGVDIPFIVVSGTVGVENAIEAIRFGAHDYVLKHDLTTLPAVIERELRKHQARESRRQAEEARRATEDKFRAIFEQAAVGIAELTASGSFLRANERLCEICGYNRAELLSMRWTDLLHPEEGAEAGERLQRLSSGEERILVLERRICRKDRTVLRARVTASRMAPARSETSVILLVEDVTASHHVQEALRASEVRLAALFRLTVVGLIVTRLKDRTVLDVNDTLVEMLGWTREEMIGRTTVELGVYAEPLDRSRLYRQLEIVGRLPPMEARMRR
jgi:PAS domain S-box-containing protein